MAQVARPVSGSTSRKLGQPFVPQKKRVAAFARRRMRRIAEARPVTDEVVERDIMVVFSCAFWRAVIAGLAIGCAAGSRFSAMVRPRSSFLRLSARRAGSVSWAL
jgi:hypothetical protein